MVYIKSTLIKEFIERMTIDDINGFARSQGITINETESQIIFTYLKEHWRTFYYGNPKPLLNELKEKLNEDAYNKIEALYIQAKNKID